MSFYLLTEDLLHVFYKLCLKKRTYVARDLTKFSHTLPQNFDFKILYESENILAIDKPPHISHHDDDESQGIVSLVREHYQIETRLFGVHRLDKETSGILLFAKSKEVASELSNKFRNKNVKKYYLALSNKKPKKKKQGWVRGDMMRSRRKAWKLVNSSDNPAITRFFTAGLGGIDFESWYSENRISRSTKDIAPKTMILFRPHTGKTHQLRCAAKSLSMPILGDSIYGDGDAKLVNRTYLHAMLIKFEIKGEEVIIYNPPTSWFSCGGEGKGMESIFTNLLKKHCEVTEIVNLIDAI